MLNLQIGGKVMLTVHSDMQDRLINIQTGNISYTAQGSVQEVYVKFSDKQVGLKGMISSYLDDKILVFLLKNVKLKFQ